MKKFDLITPKECHDYMSRAKEFDTTMFTSCGIAITVIAEFLAQEDGKTFYKCMTKESRS